MAASYLTGFAGTATVLANERFGIPIFGTMAHSFVEAHDDETAAFMDFATSRPNGLTLLIDTYDTEEGARKVVEIAKQLKEIDIKVQAVRLDSGDLEALSKSVRRILDEGGCSNITIFASGGLDETKIAKLLDADAPIDGFGVGTSLTTSSDVPAFDCAYKLQSYAGKARAKKSAGKETLPGSKQVWRSHDAQGAMTGDILSLATDSHDGTPLIEQVMKDGTRIAPAPSLDDIRARFESQFRALPEIMRRNEPLAPYQERLRAGRPYTVEIGESLRDLAARTVPS